MLTQLYTPLVEVCIENQEALVQIQQVQCKCCIQNWTIIQFKLQIQVLKQDQW